MTTPEQLIEMLEKSRRHGVFDGGPPYLMVPKEDFDALISALRQMRRDLELLNDPNAVHVNMLRGLIAKPSVQQIAHIYGSRALYDGLVDLPAPPPTEGEST